jgi:hypothetical protein
MSDQRGDVDRQIERDPRDALLDELLRAAAAEPQPLPPGLIDNVERFIAGRCRRRRRRMLVGLAAAAAVVLFACGWWAKRSLDPGAPGVRSPRPVPTVARSASAPVAEVTVSAGPDTIAVPVRQGHPRVTIYRLYAAVGPPRPERR